VPEDHTTPSAGPGSELLSGTVEMMQRFLGPVICGALQDDDVTEVYVNPQDGEIRVDRRSGGRTSFPCTLDATRAEMFLNAAAALVGENIGRDAPFLQATLPQTGFARSRLQGFLPPITRGPAFAIRKRPTVVYSLDDYVAAGTLSPPMHDILRMAVEELKNILVCGGTNTGKTTFANAILLAIARHFPTDRVVILEDTPELQCVSSDHLALATPEGTKLSRLVKATLRASPDRIIVGEVRDEAALDLLDAWATGHPGGVATMHASTPAGALNRLNRLAQRANVPSQHELILESVDLVVLMGGGRGSGSPRRVAQIARVIGWDEDEGFEIEEVELDTGDATQCA
jgi:P-type conjugative transfer ATPase TrbB